MPWTGAGWKAWVFDIAGLGGEHRVGTRLITSEGPGLSGLAKQGQLRTIHLIASQCDAYGCGERFNNPGGWEKQIAYG